MSSQGTLRCTRISITSLNLSLFVEDQNGLHTSNPLQNTFDKI